MKKNILTLFFLILFTVNSAQNNIRGIVLDKKYQNDTILFNSSLFSPLYYEKTQIVSKVKKGSFTINEKFNYPQMYYHAWKSEFGIIPMHNGVNFLDNSSKNIAIDTSSVGSFVDGETHIEYKNKFTPYIIRNNPKYLENDIFPSENKIFDRDLLNYTTENPDSYVALWFLIRQFNILGYKEVYEKTLNSFSKQIKAEKLWNILSFEFNKIQIKEGQRFPELALKNVELEKEKVKLTNSEYILVDFWFCRCKPCLEQIPQLIKIYDSYNNKGFNILAISVDRSNDIERWQKRIIEYKIPWKNYLDENGEISLSEKIISYPTNYLLDKNGKIIQKNVSLEELEKLLSERLK